MNEEQVHGRKRLGLRRNSCVWQQLRARGTEALHAPHAAPKIGKAKRHVNCCLVTARVTTNARPLKLSTVHGTDRDANNGR